MADRTVKRVLEVAKKQLGTTESPAGSNRTKFGEWYGANGQPWCAMFVSWVLARAGFPPDAYKHAYTPYGVDLFKKLGAWHPGTAGIRAGDIPYFDFPDSTYRVQHVGFATGPAKDGRVPTIEGNTASSNAGSQDNGGGVFARSRPTSHIVGYGRPAYEKSFRYIVDVVTPKRTKRFRYEKLSLAMQKVRAAVKRGRKARVHRKVIR